MDLDSSLTYYDKVLVAIPASLGGGIIIGLVTSVPVLVGLLAGALIATVWIYDATFRNPPRPSISTQAKLATVVWHLFLGGLLVAAFYLN
ncbi:MAG: hypothetical protein V5A38_13455 [Halolamina sp.]|uniref:hypothetical protein n=1 Tax=Halolamina sp. TaxID=1940283 RepID=UPI002FC28F68